MLTLNDYYNIFIETTANYKKKPGIQKTYKKLLELTRDNNKTIIIMVRIMKIDPITLKYRINKTQYSIKRYWENKLNSIQ